MAFKNYNGVWIAIFSFFPPGFKKVKIPITLGKKAKA